MHSVLSPDPSNDGEVSKLNCEMPVKKVSVQAQLPSKFFNEKLATPRVRSAIYVDEARPLRYRRSSVRPRSDRHTTETEVLVSGLSSGNRRKPWPSRKGAEVEELVKYMSSVPCYLQRIEKGESVQEKALNFGVVDWRRVEKWTSSQKIDQSNVVSSATNMAESPYLYTNQSCPYSSRSNSNSPVQRKQTSCRSSNNSPAESKPTFSVDGHGGCSDELKSTCMSHPPMSRTSPTSRSLWKSNENFPQSKHEYRTSMQTEAGSSMEEEKKPKSCEQQSSSHDGRILNKSLETNFLEHGCVLDHLSEISCERSKTLVGMHGDRKAMEACNNCLGDLPQKYSDQSSVSGDLLQSVILSAMFQSEKSNMFETALPTKKGVTATKFLTKNKELNQIGKSSGNYMYSTDDKPAKQKVEGISGGTKEPLPKHPSASGLKWLNRSSSLKDVSFSHQLKDNSALDISDDKGISNSRGRRSPLRRILDPLLKSKYDGNSGPIASSPSHRPQEHRLNISAPSEQESTSMYTMHKSSDASVIGSSNTQIPSAPQGLHQDEKYGAKMRQALVKLAWKNGQPLFMFSTNDNSVLVASMRTNRLGKEDSAGIYTIVTAQESKKKSGIWIGQSWNRKPNLLYDVVGRMEVSCSKLSSFDSKNLEISRQFVLVIDELLPNQGCIDAMHSSQLAAIIVKAPYKKLNGSIYNALSRDSYYQNLAQDKHSSLYIESLQVEKYPEYSRACSISAILPNGIHGFSELGKPSTIIERWKSGGSCDCGGWDEGCRLTVLADRPHEMKVASSVQECPTNDGFRRLELFVQGRNTENKYGFSMIAFKEGLYTVEFGSSITSLQAFAICIATLHSRNSIDVLDYSDKHKSLEDPLYENYPKRNSMQDNGGPTSYQPHHPPFSPVGRS